eukprot:PhM_4_TR5377/c0_g1_i1/m.85461
MNRAAALRLFAMVFALVLLFSTASLYEKKAELSSSSDDNDDDYMPMPSPEYNSTTTASPSSDAAAAVHILDLQKSLGTDLRLAVAVPLRINASESDVRSRYPTTLYRAMGPARSSWLMRRFNLTNVPRVVADTGFVVYVRISAGNERNVKMRVWEQPSSDDAGRVYLGDGMVMEPRREYHEECRQPHDECFVVKSFSCPTYADSIQQDHTFRSREAVRIDYPTGGSNWIVDVSGYMKDVRSSYIDVELVVASVPMGYMAHLTIGFAVIFAVLFICVIMWAFITAKVRARIVRERLRHQRPDIDGADSDDAHPINMHRTTTTTPTTRVSLQRQAQDAVVSARRTIVRSAEVCWAYLRQRRSTPLHRAYDPVVVEDAENERATGQNGNGATASVELSEQPMPPPSTSSEAATDDTHGADEQQGQPATGEEEGTSSPASMKRVLTGLKSALASFVLLIFCELAIVAVGLAFKSVVWLVWAPILTQELTSTKTLRNIQWDVFNFYHHYIACVVVVAAMWSNAHISAPLVESFTGIKDIDERNNNNNNNPDIPQNQFVSLRRRLRYCVNGVVLLFGVPFCGFCIDLVIWAISHAPWQWSVSYGYGTVMMIVFTVYVVPRVVRSYRDWSVWWKKDEIIGLSVDESDGEVDDEVVA